MQKWQGCKECTLLGSEYVPPTLLQDSDLLIIGQNPGEMEVEAGYPFCSKGKCGRELRNKLRGVKFKYSICNAVGCYTESNRIPSSKEIANCLFKVAEAINYTNPKLILVLGKPALKSVTGLTTAITKLNGHILDDYKIPVAVSVHPSYGVRGNTKVWEQGILPALRYFDKERPVEYEETTELPVMKEAGFDIETSSLKPIEKGRLKCFSVSDGKVTKFVEVENAVRESVAKTNSSEKREED